MRRIDWGVVLFVAGTAAVVLAVVVALRETPAQAVDAASSTASTPTTRTLPLSEDKRIVSPEFRAQALAGAQVWHPPSTPISQADLGNGRAPELVTCRFKPESLGGTAPKFDCLLDTGEEVRIKYGRGPEALVKKLRCYGCPDEPFTTMTTLRLTRAERVYPRFIDYSEYEEFEWVALERKYPGRPIETDAGEGWALFELDGVDPQKGGAPRAHVDALRLMAVFLAHWDNKAENQRLVCDAREWPEGTVCPEPFLLLQDVGATFGPSKINLPKWAAAPIWEDRATCVATMRGLPYDGATFRPARISESGRRLTADLLSQLSDSQLADLFAGARFDKRRVWFKRDTPVTAWIEAFKAKAAAISAGPPCPDA
jgi:hypothetical protein